MVARFDVGSLQKPLEIMILVFTAGSVFSIAVAQTALAISILLWLILLAGRRQKFPRCSYDLYFILFIAVGAISLIFSVDSSTPLPFMKRVALIPVLYLIAGTASRRGFLARVILVFCSVMTVVALAGIIKYSVSTGRLRLFNHYMTSGGILMTGALVTYAFTLVPAPRKVRSAAAAAGTVILIPLVLTFTRSSWLGLLGGLLLMCLLQNRRMIIVPFAAVVIFLAVAPGPVVERARSAVDPTHPHNRERIYMWKAGLEMMADHPLTGVGDTDMAEIYSEYKDPAAEQVHGHLHNNLIMFGAMMGIPGMLVYLALFMRILVTQIKTFRAVQPGDWLTRGIALGALGLFAGFQISGLFEWNFGDSEIITLYWLVAGLSLAAGKVSSVRAAGLSGVQNGPAL